MIKLLAAEHDNDIEGWRAYTSEEDFAELQAECIMTESGDWTTLPSPATSIRLCGVPVYGLHGVPTGRVFVCTLGRLEEGRVESLRYRDRSASILEVTMRTLEPGGGPISS